MLLKKHGLRQIDEDTIRSLDHEELIKLTRKVLSDLKEAHERLDQNSSNSSRPPSSQVPWIGTEETGNEEEAAKEEKERLEELLRAKDDSTQSESEEHDAE